MVGVELMNEVKRKLFSAAAGALGGTAALMMLTALGSLLMLKTMSAGENTVIAAGLVCACAGAFAGGFISARLSRSAGMMTGAVCGAMMFLLIIAVNLIMGNTPGAVSLLRAAVMLTAGAAGGVIGVGGKRKRKRKR